MGSLSQTSESSKRSRTGVHTLLREGLGQEGEVDVRCEVAFTWEVERRDLLVPLERLLRFSTRFAVVCQKSSRGTSRRPRGPFHNRR
jgi:hypothetical protein